MREPLDDGVSPPNSEAGGRGRLPSFAPSYQVSFTGGRSPRAGNSYVIVAQAGQVSGLTSLLSAETRVGRPSFSAMNGRFAVWHPMSPSAPVPNAHQPRQS